MSISEAEKYTVFHSKICHPPCKTDLIIVIGVGAFLGVRRIFARISLKLARQICISKMMKTFFVRGHTKNLLLVSDLQKKFFMCLFRQSVSFITQ